MKRKILLGLVAGAVALIVETLFALGCFPRRRWCPIECVQPRGLVAFPQTRKKGGEGHIRNKRDHILERSFGELKDLIKALLERLMLEERAI